MSLLDDLISHWPLNESGGPRADSHGSNTLTDVNTVGQAAGKIGDAADFLIVNGELLTTTAAAFDFGDVDFTVALWAYPTVLTGGDRRPFSRFSGTGYLVEWPGTTTPRLILIGSATAVLNAATTASANLWHFIVFWNDSANNQVGISVNGVDATVAHSGGSTAQGGGTLHLGGHDGSSQFDGRVDSVSIWSRVLTSGERLDLYNGGAGLDYPFTVPAAAGSLFWYAGTVYQ